MDKKILKLNEFYDLPAITKLTSGSSHDYLLVGVITSQAFPL